MLIINHIDMVMVFQLSAFNQNINNKNLSKLRYHFLLKLTNVFYVNPKKLGEFPKVWIGVVDFDSYLPYVFITCPSWSEQCFGPVSSSWIQPGIFQGRESFLE